MWPTLLIGRLFVLMARLGLLAGLLTAVLSVPSPVRIGVAALLRNLQIALIHLAVEVFLGLHRLAVAGFVLLRYCLRLKIVLAGLVWILVDRLLSCDAASVATPGAGVGLS